MKATLLFAHGARDPLWARPFEGIARHLREQQPQRLLTLAYLEFMTPDLATAVDDLVAQGAQVVTLVPLFLGAGGHVRKDLPALIQAARERHPSVRIDSTCAIGESDDVVHAIAEAAGRLVEAAIAEPQTP